MLGSYRNYVALVLSFVVCLGELQVMEALVTKRLLASDTSRKLVRI